MQLMSIDIDLRVFLENEVDWCFVLFSQWVDVASLIKDIKNKYQSSFIYIDSVINCF